MKRMEINVPFELKALSENGEFTGVASPYGVTDLGGDVVDRGAFTKTLAERGTKVRLLDGHKTRIGIAAVSDSATALEAKGRINLDKQAGRDAYSDLKFYQEQGSPMGLSIGFETVNAKLDGGVRHLKEVRLWEISITEFPMNESAVVTGVKSAKEKRAMERKMDFNEALDNIQTWSARYDFMNALDCAIRDAVMDESMTTPDAVTAVETAIEQFTARMTELVPKLRDLMKATYGYDFKRLFEIEKKSGRRISAETRTEIEDAITKLQALLGEEAAEENAEETDESKSAGKIKDTSTPAAAAPDPEPEQKLHSAAEILKGMRSLIPAA